MHNIRDDFPALSKKVNGHPLVYFDSAATTHKPQEVIEVFSNFYAKDYATVHRSVYTTAHIATGLYDEAREKVARFINAKSVSEVVFTRGTTDSLNIIADVLAKGFIKKGSRILISEMEHHSNIVPWQMAARSSDAILEVIPITDEGELCLESLEQMIKMGNISVVALCHCSNVLGTINPIEEIAKLLDEETIFVVDGAQSVPHLPIDVKKLGCDVFCFSAHKMYGPTGIGVLWGEKALLEKLSPTRGGSDMIDIVEFEKSTWGPLPLKFEPGTPIIAEAVGFGATCDYLNRLGSDKICAWEKELYSYLRDGLSQIKSIELLGTAKKRAPLQTFVIKDAHPLDIATLLDLKGIAIRSGHLCCQPLLKKFGLTSALRVSLGIYNTKEEIDTFVEQLQGVCAQLL
jgi:cysteine desulfurase/selenocysteine lyase